MKKSIFIQIPSYKDYELEPTILDCINKSSGKFDLRFGVSLLVHGKNDVPVPKLSNVHVTRLIFDDGYGVGFSRARANEWYAGEDYYFQIDSHERFKPNWDLYLVLELERLKANGYNKPLMSGYPQNYWFNDYGMPTYFDDDYITSFKFVDKNITQFSETGVLDQTAHLNDKSRTIRARSSCAGMVFTVGDYGLIKPNEKIMFWGEENLQSARAITNGFSLFTPQKNVVYHQYFAKSEENRSHKRNKRAHVWSDLRDHGFDDWHQKDEAGKEYLVNLFKNWEISQEGLGSVVSKELYTLYTGIDHDLRSLTEDAIMGTEPNDLLRNI